MSWFKKFFGSQLSQETKVFYEKKNENEEKKEEDELKIEELQIEEENQESSQKSWWSSWSRLSQTFNDSPKGQKREFRSDDEEENQWWKSFCSQSTKGKASSSQQSSSSAWKGFSYQSLTQNSADGLRNGDDDNDKNNKNSTNKDDDDAKVEFYVKVLHKKFKYF